jgi:hypothetical protein
MPGPVAGNQIPTVVLPINTNVFYSAGVQATWNQWAQLKDSHGNIIFTMQGSGTNPKSIGIGYFLTSYTNYTLQIGINGGATFSQILWGEARLMMGGVLMCDQYIYAAEDGGGTDYNDTILILQWLRPPPGAPELRRRMLAQTD